MSAMAWFQKLTSVTMFAAPVTLVAAERL